MFFINAVSGKRRRIETNEQLLKFMDGFENDDKDDFLKSMIRFMERGTDVYWAINPYAAELEKKDKIIYGTDRDEVRKTFFLLREEV